MWFCEKAICNLASGYLLFLVSKGVARDGALRVEH